MKNLYLIIAIAFISNESFSQIIDEDQFEEKMEMKVEQKSYSWIHKNFFTDMKLSAGSEFFIVPTASFDYIAPDYAGDPDPDTITYYDGGVTVSIFGLTLEPRFNLYTTEKSSVFIKSPLSVAFSITTNGNDRRYGHTGTTQYRGGITNKRMGFFSVNLPILLGYATGLNSTFQNTSSHGFAFSAGYQLHMSPLIGGKTNIFTEIHDDYIPIDEPYEQRKTFGMPIVQIDYYKQKKGTHKIRGYSLTACPYGNVYFKLGMIFSLSSK